MKSSLLREKGPPIKRIMLMLIAASALVIGFMPSMTQAVTCTVDTAFNPNPFITSSNDSCGLGSGDNDTAALFDSVVPGTAAYSYIDRDTGSPGPTFDEADLSFSGSTNGNWFVDSDGLNFSSLVLVLKSGPTGNDDIQWVWFELNQAIGCAIGGAPAGTDLCGTWSLWGNPNEQIRTIGHMTLYGAGELSGPDSGPGDNPGQQIPESSTLVLFGSGLMLVSAATRKFKRNR